MSLNNFGFIEAVFSTTRNDIEEVFSTTTSNNDFKWPDAKLSFPKSTNPYHKLYDEAFDKIQSDRKKQLVATTKHESTFSEFIGCTIDVLSNIDKLYADAKDDYDAIIANLDIKFETVKSKRVKYIQDLLNKKREADKKQDVLQKELDKIDNNVLELSVEYGKLIDKIKSEIDKSKTTSDELIQVLKSWFTKTVVSTDSPTLAFELDESKTNQLPANIVEQLKDVVLNSSINVDDPILGISAATTFCEI